MAVEVTAGVLASSLALLSDAAHMLTDAVALGVSLAAARLTERPARGVNHSSIHTDFMIGSDELEVDGVTADGEAVPLLRNGDWLL